MSAASAAPRQRLRFALETSHTGAWDLDLVDHTAYRSLEHDRIFGYSELLQKWTYEMFLEHVLPEDRAMVEKIFLFGDSSASLTLASTSSLTAFARRRLRSSSSTASR